MVWFDYIVFNGLGWMVGLDGLDCLRAPCLEDDNLVILAVCHEEMLEVAAAGWQHHLKYKKFIIKQAVWIQYWSVSLGANISLRRSRFSAESFFRTAGSNLDNLHVTVTLTFCWIQSGSLVRLNPDPYYNVRLIPDTYYTVRFNLGSTPCFV